MIVGKSQGKLVSRRQNTLLKGFNTRVKLEKKDGLIKIKYVVLFCCFFFYSKKNRIKP